MRTVEVSRTVRATRPEVERLLSPAALIEYEGTFAVRGVTETADGWVVSARATGLSAEFVFEPRDDGYVYRQQADTGPFASMETAIALARQDDGVRVTARSTVGLGLPLPFADRIAAWKRRGELRRALARLAADVE